MLQSPARLLPPPTLICLAERADSRSVALQPTIESRHAARTGEAAENMGDDKASAHTSTAADTDGI